MHKRIFSKGRSVTFAAAVAAVVALSIGPLGCSKDEKKAKTTEQLAPASGMAAKEHFDKGVQHTMKGETEEAIKETGGFMRRFKRETNQDLVALVVDGEMYYL